MTITATLINYYHLCHRKLWLSAHEIRMEHNSDAVYAGKVLHETAYPQRAERYQEIQLAGIKIDFFDPKEKIVHEIKRSDKMAAAHIAQLKYYLWLLEQHGLEDIKGVLEYPSLRKREEVALTDTDRREIPQWVAKIKEILSRKSCPARIDHKMCKRCSYFEFCYIE